MSYTTAKTRLNINGLTVEFPANMVVTIHGSIVSLSFSVPIAVNNEAATPVELPQAPQPQPSTAAKPFDIPITHVTKRGKELRGTIRFGLNLVTARGLDPLAFKKNGGWFIRESPASTSSAAASPSSSSAAASDEGSEIDPIVDEQPVSQQPMTTTSVPPPSNAQQQSPPEPQPSSSVPSVAKPTPRRDPNLRELPVGWKSIVIETLKQEGGSGYQHLLSSRVFRGLGKVTTPRATQLRNALHEMVSNGELVGLKGRIIGEAGQSLYGLTGHDQG